MECKYCKEHKRICDEYIHMGTPQEIQEKLDRLSAYEDTGKTPEQVTEWAKADSEGRLKALPFAIGDTVYSLIGHRYAREKEKPYPCKVVYIGINEEYMMFNVIFDDKNLSMCGFNQRDIGKRVFTTREEAKQALERFEREGKAVDDSELKPCPVCKYENKDTYNFCIICGRDLRDEDNER